jgi:hypothetical protein
MRDDKVMEKLTTLEVGISRIEQHLKDMNSRLEKHEVQLTVKCPEKHEKIDTKVDNLDRQVTRVMTIFGFANAAITALIVYLVPRMIG